MSQPRRRRLRATEEQQAEVRLRVLAGESQREVARSVFGTVAARNRVARIVRQAQEDALEQQQLRAELDEVPLVDRSLPVDEQIAQLEAIQGNIKRLRRLRELTREPDANGPAALQGPGPGNRR